MALLRVYEESGGHLRVLHPNPKMQNEGETDVKFVSRMGDDAVEKDPTLVGLLSFDVEKSAFPPRMRIDAEGDECPCRNGWRRVGVSDVVVLDEQAVPPNWVGLIKRINQSLSSEQKLTLVLEITAIREAMVENDLFLLQEIVNRIKQRQQAESIFSTPEWVVFKNTFNAKLMRVVF